ncbi:MAG: DUF4345 domain-containing protein [Spirochaetota bacterium]
MKRTYLLIVAAILTLQGLVYMVAPGAYFPGAGGTGLSQSLSEALRGFGGFYLGFAAFLVLSATREARFDDAIRSVVTVMLGVLVGRVAGIAVDGVPEPKLLVATGVEPVVAGWGTMLLPRGKEMAADGTPRKPR